MKIDRPTISLFSGAMGLDLGLEAAGLRTAVAVEKNPIAVKTIKLNRQETLPVIEDKIEDVATTEILKQGGLKPKEAFVLTGGPCCQSFSTAGKRQSLSDVDGRGILFRDFKRIVLEAQPRFFIMENVKGMLSAAVRHRPLDERGPGFPPLNTEEELGSALKIIRQELEKLNYYVVFGLVNCADYGVPQKRYRVVFIGSRDGEDICIPETTHSENAEFGKLPWKTLREAIADMKDFNPEYRPFSKDRAELLSYLKAGENWINLPKRLHRVALGAAADTWGGRRGFCRRLAWDKPSPTLTTDPTGRATTLCHPSKLRPLSVREYARLQQFPDDWQFAGGFGQKYVQIGNAVPLGLGTAIGEMLLKVSKYTDKHGVSTRAKDRLGKVFCANPELEKRLQTREKTQLHPAWKRKKTTPEEERKWLSSVAA